MLFHVAKEIDEPVNVTVPAALVGDPLFSASWPYACLTVRCVRDRTALRRFVARFAFVSSPSDDAAIEHLRAAELAECGHKRQSIRLFVAGVQLLLTNCIASAYLHEVSRLHWYMADRIGIDASRFHPTCKLQGWLQRRSTYSIDLASLLHLRQAGFSLPDIDRPLDLNLADVHRINDSFHTAPPRSARATQANNRRVSGARLCIA